MAVALLFTVLMMQGCKKNMEYEPQDFFEGRQLEVAKLIYDGDEVKLNEKLPSISKEELNRPVKADMTLLFWSVLNAIYDKNTPKRLSIITDLVKAGADPLQPRPEGGSSPAEFVLQGDKGVWIKAMLDGGLPPNSRDKVHNEPIIFEALDAKNTETLKVMLDYGADINTRDSLGNTLLISSLDSRSFDHTILLLERGCNKNMEYEPQDFFEGRQLDIAQLIYDGDEVKLKEKLPSISKEEMNRPVKADMPLLFWSVLNAIYDKNTPERLKIITDLVKDGADPLQPRPEGGSSPAEFVMKADKGIWVKAMLDGGLPPNAKDK
uniref:ANK_REP_REGION domain-containing protein n=1 Tax=Rhodnius prolixus TaxID=13249 RepID=T1HSM1_RHOPR